MQESLIKYIKLLASEEQMIYTYLTDWPLCGRLRMQGGRWGPHVCCCHGLFKQITVLIKLWQSITCLADLQLCKLACCQPATELAMQSA